MIWIPGPAGRLEAILDRPARDRGTHAVLVAHPHPQYGGNMHARVVYRAARAARDLGLPALRFNFRGVGASAGRFADGRGEAEDLRAALDHVAAAYPGRALVAGGFSFGAWLAVAVGGADPRVAALLSIGTPVGIYGDTHLRGLAKPILFVQGSRDEFGPLAALAEAVRASRGQARLVVIEGAEHLFLGHEDQVYAAVHDFLREITMIGAGDCGMPGALGG